MATKVLGLDILHLLEGAIYINRNSSYSVHMFSSENVRDKVTFNISMDKVHPDTEQMTVLITEPTTSVITVSVTNH